MLCYGMPRKKRDKDIYSLVIEWSIEDQAYVVVLPEWAAYDTMPVANAASYEQAAQRGRNALENYIRFAQEDGRPLPRPHVFVAA